VGFANQLAEELPGAREQEATIDVNQAISLEAAVANTTNFFSSTQKENVNLGWAKHIPNFTKNGQK
jgi:hypothetical protein